LRRRHAPPPRRSSDLSNEDWTLAHAGQRVQIIKQGPNGRGKLEFGTELVASKDGSLAALLGASPRASVAVQAMLDVLERCFSKRLTSGDWKQKLQEMIPSYGSSLVEDETLLRSVRQRTLATLGLSSPTMPSQQMEKKIC